MKSQTRTTWIAAGALFAVALIWNVARSAEPARAQDAEPELARTYAGAVKPFWWTFLGAESTAAVWIGPPIERISGERHRLWTVVCTHRGTQEPMSCLQGSIELDSSAPIGFQNGVARFELRPLDGWTWDQVDSKESLVIDLDGFY